MIVLINFESSHFYRNTKKTVEYESYKLGCFSKLQMFAHVDVSLPLCFGTKESLCNFIALFFWISDFSGHEALSTRIEQFCLQKLRTVTLFYASAAAGFFFGKIVGTDTEQ